VVWLKHALIILASSPPILDTQSSFRPRVFRSLIETELASWKIQNIKERVKKREREVRKSEICKTRHPLEAQVQQGTHVQAQDTCV
jgi:phage pi2 protein 07